MKDPMKETPEDQSGAAESPTHSKKEDSMSILENRYSDYEVEIRDSNGRVTCAVQDGTVYRWIFGLFRRPAQKKFVIHAYEGVTADERRYIDTVAAALPSGEWNRFPAQWRPMMLTDGSAAEWQRRGVSADDPCLQLQLQLELEIMLDNAVTV